MSELLLIIIFLLLSIIIYLLIAWKKEREELGVVRQYIETSSDSIYIVEPRTSKIIDCNNRACQFLGYNKQELLGMKIIDISGRVQTPETWHDLINTLKDQKSMIIETSQISKNGQTLPVELSATYLIQNGTHSKDLIISIVRDISEKVNTEIELQKKDELLISQSRFATMGEMIGNIAHQWRQPLSSVSMSVQNFMFAHQKGVLDEEYLKNRIDKIMDQIKYMSDTIDDFKNLFQPKKEKAVYDLKMQLEKTCKIVDSSFYNNEIEFELIIDPAEDYNHFGHPNEFSQAIINLLNNAKDACLNDKENAHTVKVHLHKTPEYYQIKVQDNAGGIEEAILTKIFDPYFTTKGPEIGTGIGLYMTKMIIEKHLGGSISVFNEDGGACFLVQLSIS